MGAAAHGSVLFPPPELSDVKYGGEAMGAPGADAAAASGEGGAAARSDPLGGAVGGDEGIAGTPGKENISTAGGNCGAAAQGLAFSPSAEGKEGLAIAGGNPGTSATTPANEAAIALKSASSSERIGAGAGISWSPEVVPGFGTAGKENISRG
jgi:hypothetical protein